MINNVLYCRLSLPGNQVYKGLLYTYTNILMLSHLENLVALLDTYTRQSRVL